MAFATSAGLPPQFGLYAAMMPAVVGALWGSSRHLVSGPTTAISIAVFAALSHLAEPGSSQYIQLVLTMTFLVGVFQLALGLARLGALVNVISHTVVIGFTMGAAVLIVGSLVAAGLNVWFGPSATGIGTIGALLSLMMYLFRSSLLPASLLWTSSAPKRCPMRHGAASGWAAACISTGSIR